jgi:hypothetical protein
MPDRLAFLILFVLVGLGLFAVLALLRRPTTLVTRKPRHLARITFAAEPLEVMERLRAVARQYNYRVALEVPDHSCIVLSQPMSFSSWGFFYPIYVSDRAEGSLLEIGIANRFPSDPETNPIRDRQHEVILERIKTAFARSGRNDRESAGQTPDLAEQKSVSSRGSVRNVSVVTGLSAALLGELLWNINRVTGALPCLGESNIKQTAWVGTILIVYGLLLLATAGLIAVANNRYARLFWSFVLFVLLASATQILLVSSVQITNEPLLSLIKSAIFLTVSLWFLARLRAAPFELFG